jgi:hypothetical protein
MEERARAVEDRLASSCRLAVWDVSQAAVIGMFDGDPHRPVAAAFSPDGKTLTIGLGGGAVRT